MQEILDYTERKKLDFAAKTPLLVYLEDVSVDPRLRLSFTPYAIPWVMGFSDLNKYVFRDNESRDPFQKIINDHTKVDDHHWRMFVKDLETLGLAKNADLTDVLRLLWGEKTRASRVLVYELIKLFSLNTLTMRLVIIESVEAGGSAFFGKISQCAREFKEKYGTELLYFGEAHEELESGHLMGTENVEATLSTIVLTPEQRDQARALVDRVFELFQAMLDSLLVECQKGGQSALASE